MTAPVAWHRIWHLGDDVDTDALAPGFARHVLSDWDLDHASAPPRAEVLRWSVAGLRRLSLAQITEH